MFVCTCDNLLLLLTIYYLTKIFACGNNANNSKNEDNYEYKLIWERNGKWGGNKQKQESAQKQLAGAWQVNSAESLSSEKQLISSFVP